jgi:Fic family protein
MTAPYKWKPFSDLPERASELSSGEMEALYLVWAEQKRSLVQSGELEKFNQRLWREWSIETGIIEGIYSLDRGTTEILLERGIDASLIPPSANEQDPTLVATILQDHQNVLEGLFAFVKGDRELTAGYVKELHASLLRHQETIKVVDQFGEIFEKKLERGTYKISPNNPTRPDGSIHEYCPPEHVAAEMDRVIALRREHLTKGIPPEVEAAWLHHVFTQTHPFEDGNGRVARAIATLVFLKAGWFPLVVTRDDRVKYIETLELADDGNLRPLIVLFSEIQKRSVIAAIELASKMRPALSIDDAIGAVRAKLVTKGQIIPVEWNRVQPTAQHLFNVALSKLNSVAEKLRSQIGSVRPQFQFNVVTSEGADKGLQLVAAQLKYAADPAQYQQAARLTLNTERSVSLVISFHGWGSQFLGSLAASAYLLQDDNSAIAASDGFFQFNYKEDKAQVEKRFHPWLDAAILKGLELWRQQL